MLVREVRVLRDQQALREVCTVQVRHLHQLPLAVSVFCTSRSGRQVVFTSDRDFHRGNAFAVPPSRYLRRAEPGEVVADFAARHDLKVLAVAVYGEWEDHGEIQPEDG